VEDIYDYIIVGSGITGLSLASNITKTFPNLKVVVLEKSKGCGGRIATRRINENRFDHGLQFIEKSKFTEKWIENWKSQNIIQRFVIDSSEKFCAMSGITQLPKNLASSLNIKYEFKAFSLKSSSRNWELTNDQGVKILGKNIVLTSPLPQSLEILERSELSYDSRFSQMQYSKALVILIESAKDFDPSLIHQENPHESILSISSQHLKGNSKTPAYTIIMNPIWSEKHFDLSDEEILRKCIHLIKIRWPELIINFSQLKKWRYSIPIHIWKNPFECVHPGVYLAGDVFGGPNVDGAIRSSNELFNYLSKTIDRTRL
jgi:renalase